MPLRRLLAVIIIILCSAFFANHFFAVLASAPGHTEPPIFVQPPDFDQPEDKVVYLTFDDGPSQNTLEILDVLKRYNIQATFFAIHSDCPGAEDILCRIVAEGHTLAPHAYVHKYEEVYASLDAYMNDFTAISQYLYDVTGVRTRVMRFPGGSANSTVKRSVRESIQQEMTRLGYVYYDWNIVSGDDKAWVLSASQLANNVMRQVKSQQQLVILFHDASIYTTTPQAVEMVIQQLTAKGYSFAPITDTTPPIQYNPQHFDAVAD